MSVSADGNPWVDKANEATSNGQGKPASTGTPSTLDYTVAFNTEKRPAGGYSGIPSSVTKVAVAGGTVGSSMAILNDMRANNPKQYGALLSQMVAAGYLGKTAKSMSSVESAWRGVLEDASARFANNPYAGNATVFDFLWSKVQSGSGSKDGSGPSGGSGSGGPFTNVTTQLTNQFDARALVDDSLNKWLGRDATEMERKDFWKQLNSGESANPQIDAGVSTAGGTSRQTQGGYNQAIAAEDFAKSRGDYAETVASTTALTLMKESLMKDSTEGLM